MNSDDIIKSLMKVKNAADGRISLLSNQGQALDGISELANYRGILELYDKKKNFSCEDCAQFDPCKKLAEEKKELIKLLRECITAQNTGSFIDKQMAANAARIYLDKIRCGDQTK